MDTKYERNVAVRLECTQECEPKYDLWPYKRWNIGGSITNNYSCVDFYYDAHLHKNLKEICQEMVALQSAHKHFHQNMTFDPIKDGTLAAASPKNNRRVDFYQDTPP